MFTYLVAQEWPLNMTAVKPQLNQLNEIFFHLLYLSESIVLLFLSKYFIDKY